MMSFRLNNSTLQEIQDREVSEVIKYMDPYQTSWQQPFNITRMQVPLPGLEDLTKIFP